MPDDPSTARHLMAPGQPLSASNVLFSPLVCVYPPPNAHSATCAPSGLPPHPSSWVFDPSTLAPISYIHRAWAHHNDHPAVTVHYSVFDHFIMSHELLVCDDKSSVGMHPIIKDGDTLRSVLCL